MSSKKGTAAAWQAWTADGAPASESDFVRGLSSWTEGTAAQLLRPLWPTNVKRPSAPEVQARLCHHLAVAARTQHLEYLDALGWARAAMIEELDQARSASPA